MQYNYFVQMQGSMEGLVLIFYFSATGNSEYVAKKIAKKEHDRVISIPTFNDITRLIVLLKYNYFEYNYFI
jgi:Flavodoxins